MSDILIVFEIQLQFWEKYMEKIKNIKKKKAENFDSSKKTLTTT